MNMAHIQSCKNGLGRKLIYGKKSAFEIIDHEAALLNKAYNNNQNLPIHDFVKNIPDKYKKITMTQFSQQYTMLQLFKFVPEAYDLYLSNKLLLCLIVFHHSGLNEVNKLITMPQHKIVEALYPKKNSELSYKSIVRMLKHRIIDYGRKKDVIRIHYFLKNLLSGKLPCYNEKSILHIKYISTDALDLEYIDIVFLLNPCLIFDAVDNKHIKNNKNTSSFIKERFIKILTTVQDALYMAKILKIDEYVIRNRLHRAKNFDLLNKFHDELTGESKANRNDELMKDEEIPDLRLVEPPIPGTDNIVPLLVHSDFIEESNEMNHCLAYGRYVHDVYKRRSYIYSVKTKDDRCTLELGINGNNEYYIKQLQGYNNALPRTETLELVNKWIMLTQNFE